MNRWKAILIQIFLITSFLVPSINASDRVEKKVLFVDSYHEGYPWSTGINKGIEETLTAGQLRNTITLKIFRMHTKRNTSEEFKKSAALQAKALIDSWIPDVVIASDDNASKHLIVPYFKNKSLPFVFCGVNWDASAYGFPCSNVTGMVEVSLIPQLLETMRQYAPGDRVGLLGADNLSNRKEAENYRRKFQVDLSKEVFVNTFDELKRAFNQLQKEVDMLILAPPSFLRTEAQKKEAVAFFQKQTQIPTGSVEDWITPYTLIGYTKVAYEQGQWAANTALKILDGQSPSEIPVVTNKRAKVFLNMRLAKKLEIKFPMELIQRATFVK